MAKQQTSDAFRQANAAVDRSTRSFLSRIQIENGIGRMVVLLALAFAFFAILKPSIFLNPLNLQNIMVASPEIGIIAVAMAFAMVTGGIDLSLVSIANFTTVTISTVYSAIAVDNPAQAEAMAPLILLLGLVVGLVGGAINGFLISTLGIAPILATLATMQIYNGLAVVWTGGVTLYGAPEVLGTIADSTVAGIPMLFIIFIIVAILVGVLLVRTPFGRRTSLQGANEIAAKYSGIRSSTVLYGTYMLTGLLGAIAGIVILSRNPTASADYGASYVLLVIVIAVLGGTNPSGGYASITGVVLATLVLQVVQSGFTALRLSSSEYAIAQGVILIAVMVFDQIQRNRKKRAPKRKPAAAASAA